MRNSAVLLSIVAITASAEMSGAQTNPASVLVSEATDFHPQTPRDFGAYSAPPEDSFLAATQTLYSHITGLKYAIASGVTPGPDARTLELAHSELRGILARLQLNVAPLKCTTSELCPDSFECNAAICTRSDKAIILSVKSLHSETNMLNQYALAIKYAAVFRKTDLAFGAALAEEERRVREVFSILGGCDTDAQCRPKKCCGGTCGDCLP